MPTETQPHADNTHDALTSSRRRHNVEPLLLNTSEVATMLSMSTSWVNREASKLGLNGYKLGRGRNAKVLYKKAEVIKWVEQQTIH
ncbi:helix-turn-helix domain-containing protein [Streptomyces sp. NPDC005426]|uniref:helix-turn-helix domain-containing protein n=1 Tax=Streptomyces sp. NPDC005426 TaxID=3155344 RepID=UPI0033BE76DA